MALVKYFDGITPIRGKVLGTVFQTGKYGAVIKGKHSSQGQLLRKNLDAQEAMSKASTLFDTLTPAQKNNWELARTSFPTEDRYGTPKISTAREVFMRTIARKPIDFQTALPIPRQPYTGAQINPGQLNFINDQLIYTTDAPPQNESFSASLFVSPPLSLGRTTSAPKMVRLLYIDAYQGALTIDLTAAYEAIFGALPEFFSINYCEEIYNQNTPQILSDNCNNITVEPQPIYLYGDAIWSVRRLKPNYTGDCIRVRRSSDDAEMNIAFVGADLDTSTLTTFIGANDGLIVKWFDQSGNGYDLSQNNKAQQPSIIISGVMHTDGTNKNSPSISFYQQYLHGGNILSFTQDAFVSSMFRTPGAGACLLAKWQTGTGAPSVNGGYYIHTQRGPSGNPRRILLQNSIGVNYASDNRYGSGSVYYPFAFEADYNVALNVYRDNAIGQGLTNIPIGSGAINSCPFTVGSLINTAGNPSSYNFWEQIFIQEINIFVDSPASRTPIYDDQINYFQ
jgi:hypothetical protein